MQRSRRSDTNPGLAAMIAFAVANAASKSSSRPGRTSRTACSVITGASSQSGARGPAPSQVTPAVTPTEEWLPRTRGTSLGRHDHHDDPEGNGPHAQAARSGCADRGGVLERRGRRAARHLSANGEGAFGHVALEAGREQAPADPGRVQGSDRRRPAFGKPRCAASATGGLTAEGARCIIPGSGGRPLSRMNHAAVFSPVNDDGRASRSRGCGADASSSGRG